jgi:hypothetical protein
MKFFGCEPYRPNADWPGGLWSQGGNESLDMSARIFAKEWKKTNKFIARRA